MFSDCFSRCYYKYNILIWQASLQTESSIPHLPVRILSKSRQLSRPAPEIRLHLLPIQKRIIPSHNPPLHQKCRRSGHKRRRKRSSTHRSHPSANCCRPDIHSRCHKIRLRPFILPGISPSRKRCIGKSKRIIRSNRYHFFRSRRDR